MADRLMAPHEDTMVNASPRAAIRRVVLSMSVSCISEDGAGGAERTPGA
jgi:hypothetical protein